MVFNRFGAGRKVYGQGSYAPTKGQVQPTGYIQREIKRRNQQALGQPVGNDGQSDRRSGNAKRMLDNRGRQAQALGPAQALSQSQMKSFNKGNKQGGKKGPVTSGLKSPANPTASVNTQAAPATPTVNINPTGQLQLPYGSEFANMALDAQMDFDAQMLELQQSEQEQALAYAQQNRDLEQGYKTQQSNSLNENAASGTAFSSAYGVDVNEDTLEYNNMKGDLTAQNDLFTQSSRRMRTQAQNQLNTLLQRAYQDYANSLAPEAGDLGLDGGEAAEGPTEGAPTESPSWDGGGVKPKMPKNMPKGNKAKGPRGNKAKPPKKQEPKKQEPKKHGAVVKHAPPKHQEPKRKKRK